MTNLRYVKEMVRPIVPSFIKKGVQRYYVYKELLDFAVRQRRLDFQVGDQPWLDEESSEVFCRMLAGSSRYLEYGSGGSTVLAAKLGKPFVSVDTDPYFLRAVRRKIGKLASNQHLEHANIGWTKHFGCPFFENPSPQRKKRWKAYAEIPWRYVEGLPPDLVMVDGRFRVASALTSCRHLAGAPGSVIVVDDYVDRPHYHIIEQYAELDCIIGRMAMFKPKHRNCLHLQEAIDRFSCDWR